MTSSPKAPQQTTMPAAIAIILLSLVAFALRVVALDRLGLAYDESASALMARATVAEIINFHWHAPFEHPPVWVLLLRGWSLLVGQSEFALRLLPAFAGAMLVPVVWRLVRTVWPHLPALQFITALFVALAPVLVYYSQEARMYTLVVLLLLVATLLVLRWLQDDGAQRPGWRTIVAFWLLCWIMLGLHYYAALALAIQAATIGLFGLLHRRRPMPWATLILAYAGAVVPVALWMLLSPGFHTTLAVVLDKAGETGATWQYFLGDLWRELTFGAIRWQPGYARWSHLLAPLVALGALLLLFRPSRNTDSSLARLVAWMTIALVVLPVLSGALALRTLVPRYILWIVPFVYLLAAVPASWLWRRHWLGGLALVALVVGFDMVALQYYFGPYRKSDYRAMTSHVQRHGDAQQELLLLEAPRQHLLAKYYLPSTWQTHPMPTVELPAYWPITAPPLVPEEEDDRILGWLAEKQGLWVSYTSEAEVDQGEFLAKYLTAVSFREHCTQWLDVRLCHYVSPHHLAPVAFDHAPTLFGNELLLTSAQGSLYTLPEGESISLLIQLDWYAQQKPTIDTKVALRLLHADGSEIDVADDFPIGPLLPPTTWNAEDRKPGYVTLHFPADLPEGIYTLQLDLYDANSLTPVTRQAVTPGSAESKPEASAPTTQPLTLAELHIGDTIALRSSSTP